MDSSTSESATSSSFQDLTKLQLHSVPVFGRDKELGILHVSYVNLHSISFTAGSGIGSRKQRLKLIADTKSWQSRSLRLEVRGNDLIPFLITLIQSSCRMRIIE